MPITEVALLPIKDRSLPLTSPLLYPHFVTLAKQQRAHSGYTLHFFQSASDPSLIILLTGWESVEAHNEWIAGEENQALLRVFAPVMNVKDIYMVHLGIEPMDVWGHTKTLVYERLGGDEEAKTATKARWEAVGKDLEGKTADLFELKGYEASVEIAETNGKIVAKRVSFE